MKHQDKDARRNDSRKQEIQRVACEEGEGDSCQQHAEDGLRLYPECPRWLPYESSDREIIEAPHKRFIVGHEENILLLEREAACLEDGIVLYEEEERGYEEHYEVFPVPWPKEKVPEGQKDHEYCQRILDEINNTQGDEYSHNRFDFLNLEYEPNAIHGGFCFWLYYNITVSNFL